MVLGKVLLGVATFSDWRPQALGIRRLIDNAQRQHNANLPISRLPTELLLVIFQLSEPGSSWQPRYNSQVCHYWREIALLCPMLWTTIDVNFPSKWYQETLRRSADAPLKFFLTSPCGQHPHQFDLLNHISRCRFFSYTPRQDESLAHVCAIWKALQKPMPCLESFHFAIPPSVEGEPLRLAMSGFCDGYAPNLRALSLTNTSGFLDCILPCLSNIREIILINKSLSAQTYSVSEWMLAFSAMPKLDTLLLSATISEDVPEDLPLPVVYFPNLIRLMILESPLSSTISILEHLVVPRLREFSIAPKKLSGSENDALAELYDRLGCILTTLYSKFQGRCVPHRLDHVTSTFCFDHGILEVNVRASTEQVFSVTLEWNNIVDILSILRVLASLSCTSATQIVKFTLEPDFIIHNNEVSLLLYNMLAKFDNITKIRCSSFRTLVCFFKFLQYGLIFPSLHTLELGFGADSFDGEPGMAWIIWFLQLHEVMGWSGQKLFLELPTPYRYDWWSQRFRQETDELHWVEARWIFFRNF